MSSSQADLVPKRLDESSSAMPITIHHWPQSLESAAGTNASVRCTDVNNVDPLEYTCRAVIATKSETARKPS